VPGQDHGAGGAEVDGGGRGKLLADAHHAQIRLPGMPGQTRVTAVCIYQQGCLMRNQQAIAVLILSGAPTILLALLYLGLMDVFFAEHGGDRVACMFNLGWLLAVCRR
jgi:hypothetical protein